MKITIEFDEKLIEAASRKYDMSVGEVKKSIEEYYSVEFSEMTAAAIIDDVLNF